MYDGINIGDCSQYLYEGMHVHRCHFTVCMLDTDDVDYGLYTRECFACKYCFGCVGLRNKSYCILNKQYTKEEYETLVPRIIAHMRETGEW